MPRCGDVGRVLDMGEFLVTACECCPRAGVTADDHPPFSHERTDAATDASHEAAVVGSQAKEGRSDTAGPERLRPLCNPAKQRPGIDRTMTSQKSMQRPFFSQSP